VTPNNYNMGIKNPEFDANLESIEKVTKKFTQGKPGLRTFVHSTKR
jgi:hypothetical protein